MKNSVKSIQQLLKGLLVFSLILLGYQAYATKTRYMVTMKNKSSFNQFKKLSEKQDKTTSKLNGQFFGASSNVSKTLENINIFIVESDKDITHLEKNPHILSVEAEVLFPGPGQMATFSQDQSDAQESEQNTDQKIETPWGISAVNAQAAWETSKAEGVNVLVIDTGVDREHPAVKRSLVEAKNFYPRSPSAKVPYDYFDDIGHGTHVAGTVLADGLNDGLVGVAPAAKLYATRVCGTFGCSPIAIVESINWGIDMGVNVMNLSLGGGVISRTERLAFARAEEMGVTVVAASGNSGTDKISFPAKVDTVIATGAISEDLQRADFSQYGDGLFIMAPGVNVLSAVPLGSGRESLTQIDLGSGFVEVPSNSFQGSSVLEEVSEAAMVFVGIGEKKDFEDVDLTGKIALIQRGKITFADKVKGAVEAGAIAVVIFNNEEGLASGALTTDGSEVGIPVVMIEMTNGDEILKVLKDKTFEPMAQVMINKTDYTAFQGTSMASPHIAGVAALVIGANMNLSPKQVREILKETSIPYEDKFQYGNGLVDSNAAVVKALTVVGDKVLNPDQQDEEQEQQQKEEELQEDMQEGAPGEGIPWIALGN